MDAEVDFTDLQLLGKILSHGYLVSGFLPLRVAFPSLAGMLLGPTCQIPAGLVFDSYVDSISTVEGNVLREKPCKSLAVPFHHLICRLSLTLLVGQAANNCQRHIT